MWWVAAAFATDDPQCPSKISGTLVAVDWPSRLGSTLILEARIVRALDLTQALVLADGQEFVVMMAPGSQWEGVKPQWVSVVGSTPIADGAPRQLPLLLLEMQGPCKSGIERNGE